MKNSEIGWTNHTWNPVTGCTQITPGCDNCYAKEIAERFQGGRGFPNGFAVTLHPERIKSPFKWREGSLIFVNSMSDLFHRDIPESYLYDIWETMLKADHHIYQILTKRPTRAAHIIRKLNLQTAPHIWLGTSVENQKMADSRVPALLSIDAPVKWLSCEPLLGPVNLSEWLQELGWVVDGGESGAKRRPAEYNWFRGIRDDCMRYLTYYLHKQGNHLRPGQDRELDGRTWDEYPPAARRILDQQEIPRQERMKRRKEVQELLI